jgi:hypothetical protein
MALVCTGSERVHAFEEVRHIGRGECKATIRPFEPRLLDRSQPAEESRGRKAE